MGRKRGERAESRPYVLVFYGNSGEILGGPEELHELKSTLLLFTKLPTKLFRLG